ncbi:hypothetical protein IWQ49_006389 [Labrenzia sp. EL_126]|nr:hypothetical protein [Labrenzia sp. EL_126]
MAKQIETYGITSHEAVVAVREIIRRAFLTFKAMPDPQASFRYQGQAWAGNIADGYGDSFSNISYRPTAYEIDQALEIMPWLRYLSEQEGAASVKRLQAWSYGVSTKFQAKREGVSEKTVMNRIDRSVSVIIAKFFGMACIVEEVEEPFKDTDFALFWRPDGSTPVPGENPRVRIQKVYVYGKGIMRNGKKWNDGRNKVKNVA